jgi:hypothetical protein
VRLLIGIMALGCLAGCGGGDEAKEPQAPPGMASEITVELPPPAEPTKVKAEGPSGAADSYRLRPPEPSSLTAAWASVLRRNDFPCDRISSARQLEREDGSAMGIYRIECVSGGTYQGTRRNGRLYFRRWTGQLYRS